jgi:hypothetical protein
MAGMYEIVGFDELVGGSYPPHSTQGYRYPYSAAGDLIAGDDEAAGDAMLSGLDAHSLIAGADPAEQLLAIAGLSGLGMPQMAYPMQPWGMGYPPAAAAGQWPMAAPMAPPGITPQQLMAIAGLAPAMRDHAVRQQAMSRSFQPRTIDVRSRAARAPRRLVLNFRQLNVPPGAAVDLPARPQLPFRPERLFVQSDIAGNFELVDIIVGNRSQFAQATPMSARIAAETSFGFDMHMDTAMVAMDVTLRIANITGAPSDFRATIVGTSAIP